MLAWLNFFAALVEDDNHFIAIPIQGIFEDRIITNDGKKREVDATICATGFAGYNRALIEGKNRSSRDFLFKTL